MNYNFQIPWFMYDLANNQLITTVTIPDEIQDTKGIVLTEVPIPGLNYAPIQPGGGGNRRIAFQLMIVKRDPIFGDVALLKQFDQLRNQVGSVWSITGKQFNPNPQVLYYWGTGSVPLVYWVAKCDAVHRGDMVNSAGIPQHSVISIELILDETHWLYKAEEAYRIMMSQMKVFDNTIGNIVKGILQPGAARI